MIYAPHTVRNQRSATSITSMILTVRPPTIGSRQAPGTFEAPRGSGKPLITGIASHLNHVPVTTCHIEDRRAPAGMRVAYITPKQGDVPSGRKQASGILIKRGSERGKCPSDTTCVPDKNKNSPPHTSRRQIPRDERGFFCPRFLTWPKKSPEDPAGIDGAKARWVRQGRRGASLLCSPCLWRWRSHRQCETHLVHQRARGGGDGDRRRGARRSSGRPRRSLTAADE
jgi:hypothetical protein